MPLLPVAFHRAPLFCFGFAHLQGLQHPDLWRTHCGLCAMWPWPPLPRLRPTHQTAGLSPLPWQGLNQDRQDSMYSRLHVARRPCPPTLPPNGSMARRSQNSIFHASVAIGATQEAKGKNFCFPQRPRQPRESRHATSFTSRRQCLQDSKRGPTQQHRCHCSHAVFPPQCASCSEYRPILTDLRSTLCETVPVPPTRSLVHGKNSCQRAPQSHASCVAPPPNSSHPPAFTTSVETCT